MESPNNRDAVLKYNDTMTMLNFTLKETLTTVMQNATIVTPVDHCTEQLDLTRMIVQHICVPVIVGIGILGNTLNVIVLTRRWMRSSTNCYLTALAIFDMAYLLMTLTLSLKHHSKLGDLLAYKYFYMIARNISNICSNTTVALTVTFTVERYIGVCYPMKGRRWCTPERAKWVILGICCFTMCVTFPGFFEMYVEPVHKNISGTIVTVQHTLQFTDFSKSVAYSMGYHWALSALFTFLPLVSLCFFNTLLIRAVMKATKLRKRMSNCRVVKTDRQERHKQEQQRITLMLISIVIVFLLCQLPSAVQLLNMTFVMKSRNPGQLEFCQWRIINNCFNLLVQINSAVNFILYSYFSTKFRMTFKRIFCKCMRAVKEKGGLFYSENSHYVDNKYSMYDSKTTRMTQIRKACSPNTSPPGGQASKICINGGHYNGRLNNSYVLIRSPNSANSLEEVVDSRISSV